MKHTLTHQTEKKLSPGKSNPRGATPKDNGVNFAIFSKYAQEVFLLLFDAPEGPPTDIIKLEKGRGYVWCVFAHGIKEGQLYGYKIRGPYDPAQAMRFNEHKLLIDPYAKAVTGKARNRDNLLFDHEPFSPGKDLMLDRRDNTPIVPKSIVINNKFDWQGDRPVRIHPADLIIYEVHLKGFTAHHSSRVKDPGTYLGFVEKIPYLKHLGINAVELLPVHEFYSRDFLENNALREYWGYNTIGFFAPESSYSTGRSLGGQVDEFKILVRELHKAGIEVILDVVFNHTGEGDELGPTLCFKGVDNRAFYSFKGPAKQPYRLYKSEATGCGNALNSEKAVTRRLILDSLRYWVKEMHVDGFRFDLATALGLKRKVFSKESHFFKAIAKDPILRDIKLIAEPWDVTTSQVGKFPFGWSEWNDRFRDTTRLFINGHAGEVGGMAWRLAGSQDLFGGDGRAPFNSINYFTCHDGFTLRDVFSYSRKHNDANKENNKDGAGINYSNNCGIEGDTKDPHVVHLRKKLAKNALCCLFFSLGTPMILGGDELFRTQRGNNNAYCQDNEISWLNWEYLKKYPDIFEFCRKAIDFRKRFAILRSRNFLTGKDTNADNIPDVSWFGERLNKPDWDNPELKFLAYQLDGSECPYSPGDYHLFFILNADAKAHSVQLPQHQNKQWRRVIDTSLADGEDFLDLGKGQRLNSADCYDSQPASFAAFVGK
ncbi:MAG: glycogen debranching protein GlgX [Candidatus Omnitrophota bacterium]